MWIVTELKRRSGEEAALILSTCACAAMLGGALGCAFAIFAPLISTDLRQLGSSPVNALMFASGVAAAGLAQVLDLALIGVARGGVQLVRNTVFAFSKLVLLWAAGAWGIRVFGLPAGLLIYATWLAGNLLSVAALLEDAMSREWMTIRNRPRLRVLRGAARAALAHHALNIAVQAPSLALPLLVTARLSATTNAHFYVAWMIASFLFVGTVALTTALLATRIDGPQGLAQKLRLTLTLSAAGGLCGVAVLWLGAPMLLGLFGSGYASGATSSLRILAVGVFPLLVKNHYVTLARLGSRPGEPTVPVALGGLLELVMAAAGAGVGGLPGLCLAWVGALFIEAAFMVRSVYIAARGPARQRQIDSSVLRNGMQAPPATDRQRLAMASDTLAGR
jgi:hypothetical protein